MNGNAQPLVKFMDGAGKRFIIPVYQRNYDWKVDNCRQLFDDLVKVIEEKRESHFFGSIVSVADVHGATSELLIIDGQQRLTTISLLFLAMVNLLEEGKIQSVDETLSNRIKMIYLVDQFAPKEKKIKLKPIKNDSDAFVKLFDDSEEYDLTSNVTRNYQCFYNWIQESKLTPDEIYDAICSLVIIDISLDPIKDDAQLIFESLNSTGLDLSEGDKIRNFILMDQNSEKQEELYYSYWNKIEIDTNYDVSGFVRDYLTLRLSKTPAMNEVYQAFKSFVLRSGMNKEELLQEMKRYAQYYKQILTSNTSSHKANIVLRRLNVLEMGVYNPFFLGLWDYRDTNNLSEKDFVEILITIETYIIRRQICGVPTNALNKIFATLHNECSKYINENTSYAEVLKYLINSKGSSGRMPRDSEFLQCFEEKDIYSMRQKYKMYIFDRLENSDSYEHTNVIEMMQDGVYTVEHIMPQTLSSKWMSDLGDNYSEVHDIWQNRIANLTLTGYNVQYSNRPFTEKRDIENGFRDSHLHLNAYVSACEKWTLEEILNRNAILKDKAISLWPYPETSFKPEEAVSEVHYLDEEFNYKGKTIVSYTFMDTPYSAAAWVDMYIQMIKFLYDLDSTIMHRLVKETEGVGSHFESKESNGFAEISKGVYLWVASSTMSKINNLKRVFEIYGIDGSELAIEIESEIEE